MPASSTSSPPDVRPARGSYAVGRETRSAILDAAGRLFRERGLGGVSKAQIAREAGVFPSQLGYYFGTKEALFVEAACRDVLHLAGEVESAAARTRTPRTYARALVQTALDSPVLLFFVEAVLLVRTHRDLAPRVADAFERLYGEGERASTAKLAAHGWRARRGADVEARGFWAAMLRLCLEQVAVGEEISARSVELTEQLVRGLDDPSVPTT